MSTLALLALVIIAAVVGTLTAYLTERVRAESAWLDEIRAAVDRAHTAGTHARPGGRGPCIICGDKDDQ